MSRPPTPNPIGTLPHLTDTQLFAWLVIEEHRRRQTARARADGIAPILLRPWPPCPLCGTPVTNVTARQHAADGTRRWTLHYQPTHPA